MFCPQCSSENSLEQKYCRRCGLELTAAQISLQGGVGAALTRHKKGQVIFSSGGLSLIIFTLAALANIFLGSGPQPVLINLLLGLATGVPLMAAGLVQLRRAGVSLQPVEEHNQLASDNSKEALTITSSPYATDPLLPPGSVTEQTTQNLKSREE